MDQRRKPRHRWSTDFTGKRHTDDECLDCGLQRIGMPSPCSKPEVGK
jgi:hypothetical protein